MRARLNGLLFALLIGACLVPSAEAKKFRYASGPRAPEDSVLSVANTYLDPVVRSEHHPAVEEAAVADGDGRVGGERDPAAWFEERALAQRQPAGVARLEDLPFDRETDVGPGLRHVPVEAPAVEEALVPLVPAELMPPHFPSALIVHAPTFSEPGRVAHRDLTQRSNREAKCSEDEPPSPSPLRPNRKILRPCARRGSHRAGTGYARSHSGLGAVQARRVDERAKARTQLVGRGHA